VTAADTTIFSLREDQVFAAYVESVRHHPPALPGKGVWRAQWLYEPEFYGTFAERAAVVRALAQERQRKESAVSDIEKIGRYLKKADTKLLYEMDFDHEQMRRAEEMQAKFAEKSDDPEVELSWDYWRLRAETRRTRFVNTAERMEMASVRGWNAIEAVKDFKETLDAVRLNPKWRRERYEQVLGDFKRIDAEADRYERRADLQRAYHVRHIHDGKLYTEVGDEHGRPVTSFEQYCREGHLGVSRSYAYRAMGLADAADVAIANGEPLPPSERAVREAKRRAAEQEARARLSPMGDTNQGTDGDDMNKTSPKPTAKTASTGLDGESIRQQADELPVEEDDDHEWTPDSGSECVVGDVLDVLGECEPSDSFWAVNPDTGDRFDVITVHQEEGVGMLMIVPQPPKMQTRKPESVA
jgi:hypothetical protein